MKVLRSVHDDTDTCLAVIVCFSATADVTIVACPTAPQVFLDNHDILVKEMLAATSWHDWWVENAPHHWPPTPRVNY